MIGQLLGILAGILALMMAGAISYTYLEETFGMRDVPQVQEAPLAIIKKEVAKVATTTKTVAKEIVTKSPAPTTPIKTNGSLVPKAAIEEKTVVAPGPLRVTTPVQASVSLTVRGVIEHTNIERAQNGGLGSLAENSTLNHVAQMKVDDMFAKQYFEHVSPSGVGQADLAQTAGYAYVIVGENLALGDFDGDQGVVTAWMNSPGHRANILNPHYKEIGVAVGKGMYEGRETWLAVQSFGMPLSACPTVDQILKAQVDANNVLIANLRSTIDAKKIQIESTSTNDSNYNTYVSEFNALLPEYNSLVENNRVAVVNYNAGVQAFNVCISVASGH